MVMFLVERLEGFSPGTQCRYIKTNAIYQHPFEVPHVVTELVIQHEVISDLGIMRHSA